MGFDMKIISFATLATVSVFAFSASSMAGSKPWPHITHGSGYQDGQNYDFVPYRDSGKATHMAAQKHETPWKTENWTSQVEAQELLRRFYVADIIRDQYENWDDVQVLVVGPNFHRLSDYDKGRIVATIDASEKLTDKSVGGIYIEDWASENTLGVYTAKYGLQFQ